MSAKRILMLLGDYVEEYEAMAPFQALQRVARTVHAVLPGSRVGWCGACPPPRVPSGRHPAMKTRAGANDTLSGRGQMNQRVEIGLVCFLVTRAETVALALFYSSPCHSLCLCVSVVQCSWFSQQVLGTRIEP